MTTIELRMFGAFRKYASEAGVIDLNVQAPSTIDDVKCALLHTLQEKFPEFSDRQLILDSAIADESHILGNGEAISAHTRLAILPPVCGG